MLVGAGLGPVEWNCLLGAGSGVSASKLKDRETRGRRDPESATESLMYKSCVKNSDPYFTDEERGSERLSDLVKATPWRSDGGTFEFRSQSKSRAVCRSPELHPRINPAACDGGNRTLHTCQHRPGLSAGRGSGPLHPSQKPSVHPFCWPALPAHPRPAHSTSLLAPTGTPASARALGSPVNESVTVRLSTCMCEACL